MFAEVYSCCTSSGVGHLSPQVILATIVGYFAGKFSYATTCADKLLYQVH